MAMNSTVYGLLFEDGISSSVKTAAEVVKDFLFNDEIEKKSLLNNLYVPLTIVTTYVLLVKWIGPSFMKDRKPYNFKTSMILYNFVNAALNTYMAYNLIIFAWNMWPERCLAKTNPNLPDYLSMIRLLQWHWTLMKYFDLCDTVFFMLRKKNNQITYLHVFHHVGMCLIAVFLPRIGEYGFYLLLAGPINCVVHVIMYTYYGLAAFGTHMQKYLWWKKYITLIQMGQFVFMLFYLLIGFITGCESMDKMELSLFTFIGAILLLFLNFYRKSYKHHKSKKTT